MSARFGVASVIAGAPQRFYKEDGDGGPVELPPLPDLLKANEGNGPYADLSPGHAGSGRPSQIATERQHLPAGLARIHAPLRAAPVSPPTGPGRTSWIAAACYN